MADNEHDVRSPFNYPILNCDFRRADFNRAPFEPDEVLPFNGDDRLVELAMSGQRRVRETQIARVVRDLTFRYGRRPPLDELIKAYGITSKKA